MDDKKYSKYYKYTNKYRSKKYRPNVLIPVEWKEEIEEYYTSKGFDSFNQWVTSIIITDVFDGLIPQNEEMKK